MQHRYSDDANLYVGAIFRDAADWIVNHPPHILRRIGRLGCYVGRFFRWLL